MASLSNSGEEVLSYQLVRDDGEHTAPYCDADLKEVYCIERCANWIKHNSLTKVAVQFPQEYSHDAPLVLLLLMEEAGVMDVYIIYNSATAKCCVSQKDAEYRAAEGIIQFGRSCLTAVPRVPVLRVFAPHWQVDAAAVVRGVCAIPEVAEVLRIEAMERPSRQSDSGGHEEDPSTATNGGLSQSEHFEESHCDADHTSQTLSSDPTNGYQDTEHLPRKELIILYDTRCAHAMSDVEERLREVTARFQISRLLIDDRQHSAGSVVVSSDASSGCCHCAADYSLGVCGPCLARACDWQYASPKENHSSDNIADDSGMLDSSCSDPDISNNSVFVLNNRLVKCPKSYNHSDLLFVYVGRTGPTLTSMSLKWPQCSFFVTDPKTGQISTINSVKRVMQRNFMIEKIRDAQKIGLLISNYNLPKFHAVFSRLSSLIKKAGKKPFVQYSAHPDLPKLMNIPNIDVYIYIACPESTIIERQADPDMYKMMATPWELDVALNPNQKWRLNFETDSLALLEGGSSHVPLPDDFREESVSVSLLTNKLQVIGIAADVEVAEPLDSKTGAVTQSTPRQVGLVVEGHRRGLLWGETAWRGLDPGTETTAPLGTVVEGMKGVAGGYSAEGRNQLE